MKTKIAFNKDGDCTEMLNFEVLRNGGIKTIGYKSLRGFAQILKRQNKVCNDMNIKCRFDITLPIKE